MKRTLLLIGLVAVVNNTLTGNTATTTGSQTAAMQNDGAGVRVISNNILWHNTTATQAEVRGAEGIYVRNLKETITGAPQAGSAANIVADPLFMGASDFRLTLPSPALDYGDSTPWGGTSDVDLAGQARLSGPSIDLGAYEVDFGSPVPRRLRLTLKMPIRSGSRDRRGQGQPPRVCMRSRARCCDNRAIPSAMLTRGL